MEVTLNCILLGKTSFNAFTVEVSDNNIIDTSSFLFWNKKKKMSGNR
jgi:hypothetical protein